MHMKTQLRRTRGYWTTFFAAALALTAFAAAAVATDAIEGDDYFSTDLHPAGAGAPATRVAPVKKPSETKGEGGTPAPAAKGEVPAAAAPTAANRVREGTRLTDRLGSFKIAGDGVTFFSADGELRLAGLQNLAMERIARVLRDSHSEPEWLVTGVVTEYEGGNFLLLQRAVLKTKVNLPGGAFPGAGK